MRFFSDPFKSLFACLIVIVLCMASSSWIQTSGGKVAVSKVMLPTQNGQNLAATLFKPLSATVENPAPFIAVVPGFQRSREALSNIAIELSRRGFVVVSIDPYGQGSSSSSMSTRSATYEGYGMFALIDYVFLTNNLNYVDKNRIAATGHSAGGNAAIRGAAYFGREAKELGVPSKLHSVYVSGYVLTLRKSVLRDVKSNIGVSYALYDEGAFRNKLKSGDMRYAPEALRVVNSGVPSSNSKVTEVELGKFYGDVLSRNARVIHNEPLLHPFQPYNGLATENQISYFEKVLSHNSTITPDNQIWQWKELFGLISLITSLIMLIPLGKVMLRTSFFHEIVKTVPPSSPPLLGRAKILFWALFALSAMIACTSFIPMVELSKQLFVDASTRKQTWFFPQRMNNPVMLWALFNGCIGFLIFFLHYKFFGKHNGSKPDAWGVIISRTVGLKTILLGLLIFSFYYLLLFLIDYFFLVDYRFWFMGVRVFQPSIIVLLIMYAPVFFVFFLMSSLRTNTAMRIQGQSEWFSMFLSGIGNSLGLILIIIIQYTYFAATGEVYWTTNWLYINLLFGVVPMMFALPYFNRYFFNMTGRIYLGPVVTCLVFIMILSTNTVSYIPI